MPLRFVVALLLAVAAAPAGPLATGPHDATLNGARLWYRVAGAARGEPVVFLHGGPGQGSQVFALTAGPVLEKKGLRMVYLDQRGSGASERPSDKAYSLALLIEDLEQLRRTFGVERMALIGHSFGTAIALEYAAKYPEHVSRMVLSGAVPDVPTAFAVQCARVAKADPPAYARAVAAAAPGGPCNLLAAYPPGPEMQRFIRANMFPDPRYDATVTELQARNGQRNTGELGAAIMRQGFLQYRFARPERLTMPVLFIAGGEDHQAVIEPQRALAARLPRGRVLEYAGRGHFMFVEDPERFGRDVAGFLRAR